MMWMSLTKQESKNNTYGQKRVYVLLSILLAFSEDIHRADFLTENFLKKRILGKILKKKKKIHKLVIYRKHAVLKRL